MGSLINQSSQDKQTGENAKAKGQVQFPNQQECRIRENCLRKPTDQTYHLVSKHHSIYHFVCQRTRGAAPMTFSNGLITRRIC